MALSVVETNSADFVAAVNSFQVSIATAPTVGDRIYLVVFFDNNPATITGPTGLGATWTIEHTQGVSGNWKYIVYLGSGATSSGIISMTTSFSVKARMQVLNVRGLTSTIIAGTDETSWDTNTETVSQPVQMPQRGVPPDTLVLNLLIKGDVAAPSYPVAGSSPGWVTSTNNLTSRYYGLSYYLANTQTANLSIGATPSNIAYVDMTNIYIGGPAGTRAVAAAGEVLTVGTPQMAADAAYAELLTSFTAALAADTAYVEVLSTTQTALIEQGAYAEILIPTVLAATVRYIGWGIQR